LSNAQDKAKEEYSQDESPAEHTGVTKQELT